MIASACSCNSTATLRVAAGILSKPCRLIQALNSQSSPAPCPVRFGDLQRPHRQSARSPDPALLTLSKCSASSRYWRPGNQRPIVFLWRQVRAALGKMAVKSVIFYIPRHRILFSSRRTLPLCPPGRRPRNPVNNERGAVTQTNIVGLGGSRDSLPLAAPSLDPKHRGKRLSSPPASTVIDIARWSRRCSCEE